MMNFGVLPSTNTKQRLPECNTLDLSFKAYIIVVGTCNKTLLPPYKDADNKLWPLVGAFFECSS